jgi:hypothetical protein
MTTQNLEDAQKTCKRLNKAMAEIAIHCANWDAYSRSPAHAVKVVRLITAITKTALERQ